MNLLHLTGFFWSISLHIKVEKCEVIYNKNPKKIFKYCGFFIYCKINCFTGSIANSRRQKCGWIGKPLHRGQCGVERHFAYFIVAGFSLLLLGMYQSPFPHQINLLLSNCHGSFPTQFPLHNLCLEKIHSTHFGHSIGIRNGSKWSSGKLDLSKSVFNSTLNKINKCSTYTMVKKHPKCRI